VHAPLVWDHGAQPQNVSSERMRRLPLHGILIESRISKLLRRTLMPKRLRQKLRAARTIGTKRPQLPDPLRERLEAQFIMDRGDLVQMYPDHAALDLCYPFAPT
jgi:hypothetical protein